MPKTSILTTFLSCCFVCGFVRAVEADQIYWTTVFASSIMRADLDNPGPETFTTDGALTTGIALDLPDSKLYWGEKQPDGVFRGNLDGTGFEMIIGPCGPSALCSAGLDLELDRGRGKLYWTESGLEEFYAILRANTDGSEIELLLDATTIFRPTGLALDLDNEKMYWGEGEQQKGLGGKLRRANLDGSNVADLLSVGVFTPALELDLVVGKMYWTSNHEGEVWRANLDGSLPELLLAGLDNPLGLALDLGNGKMYVADHHAGQIISANLDGTAAAVLLVTNPFQIEGLALEVTGDNDQDGVLDEDDDCDISVLGGVLEIDDCEPGVDNHFFNTGCSMVDLIGACAEGARNHGGFVRCVSQLTKQWRLGKLITGEQRGAIMSCAAQANLP